MSDAIIKAAAEHCWQEEQLAHAEWLYGLKAHQRAELDDGSDRPWRTILRTSARELIAALETAGFYDASILADPRAKTRTPNVYRQSPYDYEIAQRVEAKYAEQKWAEGPSE